MFLNLARWSGFVTSVLWRIERTESDIGMIRAGRIPEIFAFARLMPATEWVKLAALILSRVDSGELKVIPA